MDKMVGNVVQEYINQGMFREDAIARIHQEIRDGILVLTDSFMLQQKG